MAPLFVGVSDMQAPDDNTFTITLKQPSASFLRNVSTRSTTLLIYPPQVPKADWYKTMVGTGPFRLKQLDQTTKLVVEPDRNYWKVDGNGQQLPFLDGVEWHKFTDYTNAAAAYKTGRINAITGGILTTTGAGHADEFRAAQPGSNLQIVVAGTDHFWVFANKAPWNDKRVRQAIRIGYDYKAHAETISSPGINYWYGSVLLPSEFGGEWGLPLDEIKKIPGWTGDRAKELAMAKQLLADAGLAPGHNTKVVATLMSTSMNADGELIQQLLKPLGFDVQPKIFQTAEAATVQRSGTWDMYHMFGVSAGEPADYLIPTLGTGGLTNYGNWSNPTLDKLFAEQEVTLDTNKRREMLYQVQRIVLDESYVMPEYWIGALYGVGPGVHNFKPGDKTPYFYNTSSAYRYERIWIDKAKQ